MKTGQNPLLGLTTLEVMAAQLMQQNFLITPEHALMQFLAILPDDENEVEKRTFTSGQKLNREQVLLAIRTRYEVLRRQKRKGATRKDAG